MGKYLRFNCLTFILPTVIINLFSVIYHARERHLFLFSSSFFLLTVFTDFDFDRKTATSEIFLADLFERFSKKALSTPNYETKDK